MTSIVGTLAFGYLALIGVMFFAQRQLMYQPGQGMPPPTASDAPEMETVTLSTADGLELQSWIVPPPLGGRIVIYFHGNAGHIADRDYKARAFIDGGLGVMLVGYRGYGDNPGRPSEEGFYMDAEAALAHVASLGIAPEDWVLYGESLGTGVAVEMAYRRAAQKTPVGAVVLEAPFTAMGDAAQSHYPYLPARLLVRDRYDSLAKIDAIAAPLLIIHGDRDRVVPFKQGQRLFDAAHEPKKFLAFPGGAHSNLYDFGAAAQVLRFLRD